MGSNYDLVSNSFIFNPLLLLFPLSMSTLAIHFLLISVTFCPNIAWIKSVSSPLINGLDTDLIHAVLEESMNETRRKCGGSVKKGQGAVGPVKPFHSPYRPSNQYFRISN